MKNFILLFLFLFSIKTFSQEYTAKIAKEVCECLQKAKSENPDRKKLEVQLGLCMIKASQPYTKELKKDFNIDLLSGDGEKSGEIMATWLLKECPSVFMDVVNSSENEEEQNELLISGKVSKIEEDKFIVFHVTGDNKILNKLYWISTIDSNLDLPNVYKALLNKNVSVSYFSMEIFDPKINGYRNLNIISTLKTEE